MQRASSIPLLIQMFGIVYTGRSWTTGIPWQRRSSWPSRLPRRKRSTWGNSKCSTNKLNSVCLKLFSSLETPTLEFTRSNQPGAGEIQSDILQMHRHALTSLCHHSANFFLTAAMLHGLLLEKQEMAVLGSICESFPWLSSRMNCFSYNSTHIFVCLFVSIYIIYSINY